MDAIGATVIIAFLLFAGVCAAGLHYAAKRERHEAGHRQDNEMGGSR